jgi:hypothetical protein
LNTELEETETKLREAEFELFEFGWVTQQKRKFEQTTVQNLRFRLFY